ncbi:MAG: Ig-like domain-containing protein, partial [Paramuribaculum sp.]|nr:Ig-like domain-containing protein [Paramuribaculum sp.]
ITVTVKATIVDIDGITLNIEEAEIKEGESVQLTATVSPENATDKSVTWTSDDETIATVDATGKVTALKAGKTDITATTANGIYASCRITVKSANTGIHEADREKDLPFIIKDGNLIIDENIPVEIFNLSGVRVYKSPGKLIGGLPHGIYILRANGKTYKISL